MPNFRSERRRMMLRHVIAVEAAAVVSLRDLQPVGIELAERHVRLIDMVENAELQIGTASNDAPPRDSRRSRCGRKPPRSSAGRHRAGRAARPTDRYGRKCRT